MPPGTAVDAPCRILSVNDYTWVHTTFLLWGYPVNEDSATTHVAQRSGTNSLPVWFWVISVVALLWYLMDMSAFFMRVFMTEEAIESMPENQQHLYRDMPLWGECRVCL